VVAGATVCLLTMSGFLGDWFWGFDLASYFRFQHFILLLVFSLALIGLKRRRTAATFAVFTLINGWLLLPFVPLGHSRAATSSGESVRLLAWNVNSRNREFSELRRLVEEHDPDFLLLLEVDDRWSGFLAGFTNYPTRHIIPRDDNFGIAILSRDMAASAQTRYLGEAGLPSLQSDLSIGNQAVTILSTHPLPPVGSVQNQLRNEQLDRVSDWVNARTNPVIVVGDLNTTPWSPVFRRFAESTGLMNSAEGRGLQSTWPAFFRPMLIPIDHFLHTDGVFVVRREILPASGSDHLPQLIEFCVR